MSPTQQKLALEVEHYRCLARGNYFTVWILYFLSVGASIAATFMAALGTFDKTPLAVVTAIPGVVLLLTNTFKFNARSQWHYEKRLRLQALSRLAEAGAKATTDPEVAEKWNRIDEDMEKSWPGWGELPKSAHKPAPSPDGQNTP
jgi:hypothetical protein